MKEEQRKILKFERKSKTDLLAIILEKSLGKKSKKVILELCLIVLMFTVVQIVPDLYFFFVGTGSNTI